MRLLSAVCVGVTVVCDELCTWLAFWCSCSLALPCAVLVSVDLCCVLTISLHGAHATSACMFVVCLLLLHTHTHTGQPSRLCLQRSTPTLVVLGPCLVATEVVTEVETEVVVEVAVEVTAAGMSDRS